ncbi:uncharacterized protein LOC141532352 [Cotesia typhae]|uniref:uncharacterized protein LOC141532352 n=1 Tax=Cotesia typhae TaxID=2053667 RepID=UPI003D69E0B3
MYTYVLILQLVAVFSVLAVERAISTTYLLGYPCLIHSDCPDHAGCYSSQCSCYSGYRADNGLCVKYATKVGDSCSESFLMCRGVKNSYCSYYTCKCRWGYTEVSGKCRPTLDGTCVFNSRVTAEQCYGDGLTCSKDNKCICKDDYVRYMRQCWKKAEGLFNGFCSSDIQCEHLPNSECRSICICKLTYAPKLINGRNDRHECVKSLGASCKQNQDCVFNNLTCLNSICQCHEYYYETENTCYIKIFRLNEDCNHYNACLPSHSSCYNGKCRCDWNYFEKDGSCLKNLHAPCRSQDECKKDNSNCINGKCACMENFEELAGECRN